MFFKVILTLQFLTKLLLLLITTFSIYRCGKSVGTNIPLKLPVFATLPYLIKVTIYCP